MYLPKVLLFVDYANAFYRHFLRGIIQYTSAHREWHWYRQSQITDDMLKKIKDWNPSGIIAQINTIKQADRLSQLRIPVVAIMGVDHPGIERKKKVVNVMADEPEIGKMAAEFFLEKKFRNFAYCGRTASWSEKRGKAFEEYIQNSGYATNIYSKPDNVRLHSLHKEEEYLLEWIESLEKPVAIFSSDDNRARQIIEMSKIANYHVPDDIAVLGVDNDDLVCELSMPPLSSIALNARKAGYEAAEILDTLMNNKPSESGKVFVQPTYIAARRSTDIMAIENMNVVKALRYIRENSDKLIQISDVVNATFISRRSLEREFKQHVEKTILQEIRESRADYIAELLVKTNKTTNEISMMLGYNTMENLSRYFKKIKGMTPKEYRKKYGKGLSE